MSRRRTVDRTPPAQAPTAALPVQRDPSGHTRTTTPPIGPQRGAHGPTPECPTCGQPLPPGHTLTPDCAGRLSATLHGIPTTLDDLDTAATHLGTSWRTGDHRPGPRELSHVPVTDHGPAALALEIRRALTTAGRRWATSRPGPQTRTEHRTTLHIAAHPDRIARALVREHLDVAWWAPDLAVVLEAVMPSVPRAIGDRPEPPAPRPRPERTGTAADLARLLGVTPSVIRNLAHRGRLTSTGTTPDGRPTYVVADVREALDARETREDNRAAPTS